MDICSHLPKVEDECCGGNDLGTKDGGDDEGKDEKHHGSGVGGSGSDSGGRDVVVIIDSCTFMHKPCGLKGLVVWTRVHWMADPMMFNAIQLQPLTNASSCML